MRMPHAAAAARRLPRRTLRAQLALLYAAVFGLACAAVGAIAVIFKPDFLVGTSCSPAPGTAVRPGLCGQSDQLSFAGTIAHDAGQNLAGLAMVVVVAVLAVGVGWLIAGRVLRPLRTITASARDISARNLHQRLAIDGPDDEFRQLGETLDGLFGRLEAAFQAQRHFVANASHELRTPVAAEKTVLQVALADPGASAGTLRSACEKALRWNDQQERLIDSLLTLVSSEREIERWEPFDLADIAGKVVAGCRQEAERRDIRIDPALSAAPATGDPALAESLIANLVGNAIRHNMDGGRVEVSTGITDGLSVITVSNTGPLVAADEVDRLFQPFQRQGSLRSGVQSGQAGGHGLGLAIVSAIAGVHGAALTVDPRREGGLDINVSFPRTTG
ncbi:MAG TPA: HAMP domain-containing sensor histidine kinase [Streptosporangiaceae bacterium]|nr:HAMP domain-containing sensor histidine kinase [Streptosporangiaceae bacterium]